MNEQIQMSSFEYTSGESFLNFITQESKVLKWKRRLMPSFTIKHTWQTPLDNFDKGIQKQDRDCAMFAFHQYSANSKSSKGRFNDSIRNVWNVTTHRSSAIDVDIKVSQRSFRTASLAPFSNRSNHRRLIQEVSFSLQPKYGMSRKHVVPRPIYWKRLNGFFPS